MQEIGDRVLFVAGRAPEHFKGGKALRLKVLPQARAGGGGSREPRQIQTMVHHRQVLLLSSCFNQQSKLTPQTGRGVEVQFRLHQCRDD